MALPAPLAWQMLVRHRRRCALGAGAIAVAVLIMVMELGFFHGFGESQALLPPLFDADLVLMDSHRTHLNRWTMLAGVRLAEAAALPEVSAVVPVYNITYNLRDRVTHRERRIYVLAVPPRSHALKLPGLDELLPRLEVRGTVLFDRRSRAIYGAVNPGQVIELNRQFYTVGGLFSLGPSFSNDGTILMSEATYRAGHPDPGTERVDWALLRLKPGTDRERFRARLLAALPSDVTVLTPTEMWERELRYTASAVPVGAIFGVSLAVAFCIGVIVCYQALFTEITLQLPQFAALLAMGFSRRFVGGLVVQQSLLLAGLGFVPGLVGGWLLCGELSRRTDIVLRQTPARVGLLLGLTLLMCLTAGLLALRRAVQADPAAVLAESSP